LTQSWLSGMESLCTRGLEDTCFAACLIQKVGNYNFHQMLLSLSVTRISLLNNKEIPHLMVVRNPLRRSNNFSLPRQSWVKKNHLSFYGFVTDLYTFWVWERSLSRMLAKTLNNHFRPMHMYCNLQGGFQFDYNFKLKEVSFWLPELLKFLIHDPSSLAKQLNACQCKDMP